MYASLFYMESPHGVVINLLDCDVIVIQFKFQLDDGLNSTTPVIQQEWLLQWITHKGWYAIKQRHQTKQFYIKNIL